MTVTSRSDRLKAGRLLSEIRRHVIGLAFHLGPAPRPIVIGTCDDQFAAARGDDDVGIPERRDSGESEC